MAKPKMYGKVKPGPAMGQGSLDRMWQRKLQRQRNREKQTPKPAPAQIVKEKEGPACS